MGRAFGQFPETTPRSSHVGQPGYDAKAIWDHFVDKYRERLLQFGKKYFPKYSDMVEDVYNTMVQNLLLDPNILAYKPGPRFRSVLIQLFNRIFYQAIRDEKSKSRGTYRDDASVLYRSSTTQECDRHRIQRLVIDTIRYNLLDPDYPNGCFTPEINSLDLSIWRCLQDDHTTMREVARKFGHPLWKVFQCKKRVDDRIKSDAFKLLASQGLL